MKIGLLILSDIHVDTNNPILDNMQKIYDSIKNYYFESDVLCIVLPGDIAFSGKNKQYDTFFYFIEGIKEKLLKYKNMQIFHAISPGNHDNNYELETSVRKLVIEKIKKDPSILDDKLIDECVKVQDNYRNFCSEIIDKKYTIFKDNLLHLQKFEIAEFSLQFSAYNLSWLSQKGNDYGYLYFPIEKYSTSLFDVNANLRIALFHHPIRWLQNSIQRKFMEHLSKTSDLIITGHEHVQDNLTISSSIFDSIKIIESGALYDYSMPTISQFGFILIDTDNLNNQNITLLLRNKNYIAEKNQLNLNYIVEGQSKSSLIISDTFSDTINDVGANYLHNKAEKLFLSDIYIYPDLVDLSSKYLYSYNEENNYKKFNSISLVGIKAKKMIIIGQEKIGKTSLLNTLFFQYYNKGYFPIYLNGNKLKVFSERDIRKKTIKAFIKQYKDVNEEIFDHLDRNKIIIILDDIDHCSFNEKYYDALFQNIKKLYENIILSADELFRIEDVFIRDQENKKDLIDFKFYEIMPFGHYLRKTIIRKWLKIGQDIYTTELQLQHQVEERRRIIDSIIGNNFVPSFPFYILTLLQTIDSGKPNTLEHSSYGYYYDYLITNSLYFVKLNPNEIDAYNNFLTEFAYYLYSNQQVSIVESDFNNFFCQYKNEYDISIEYTIIYKKLLESRLITKKNDVCYFKYKYLYYYYLARYLANNIQDKNIIDTIKLIIKGMHKTFNGNVLMFLTHLSRKPLIINSILQEAGNCFNKLEEIEFNNDIDCINNLIDEVPQLVISNIKAGNADDKKQKQVDLSEVNSKDCEGSTIEYPNEDNNDKFELITEIIKSFKSIELLGQIAKSYYGSLKAPIKQEIISQAYSICLRSLKSYFDFMSKNLDFIVHDISEFIKTKRIADEKDIRKITNTYIFKLSCLISYMFIKKTAFFLSTKDLEKTFQRILDSNNTIAKMILDICIKLGYSIDFPKKSVLDLHSKIGKNYLPDYILKRVVIDYFYLYDVDIELRQSVCDLLGISVKCQKNIIQKSERIKRIKR